MSSKTICLFDVDGTLTKPMQEIERSLKDFLVNVLKRRCAIGLVGGSDLQKIGIQMGGQIALKDFDYTFAENGLVALKNGELLAEQSIQEYVGEERLQKFINFCLEYMSKIELPRKRGTFVEFRKGIINVCPIGRSCSLTERLEFVDYDAKYKVRESFVAAMKKEFPDYGLEFAIGGQISIDVYPTGWDKRFCLKFLEEYGTIYFFGDKTMEGGNDYHIFNDPKVKGHTVTGPENTTQQIKNIFSLS